MSIISAETLTEDGVIKLTYDKGLPYQLPPGQTGDKLDEYNAWVSGGGVTTLYDPYEGRDLATAKAEKIQAIKLGARRQFREYTDWYVIRKAESGTTIPVAVTSYRNQMRTAVADAENVINSLTTKQAVADYSMIWPSKPGGL